MTTNHFSTLGGRYGWTVTTRDGLTMSEADGTWAEIPSDVRLQSVGVVELATGSVLAQLSDCDRFFFSNEALSSWSGMARLTAKIFGGVRGADAIMLRVEFPADGGTPTVETYQLPAAEIAFSSAAFREG